MPSDNGVKRLVVQTVVGKHVDHTGPHAGPGQPLYLARGRPRRRAGHEWARKESWHGSWGQVVGCCLLLLLYPGCGGLRKRDGVHSHTLGRNQGLKGKRSHSMGDVRDLFPTPPMSHFILWASHSYLRQNKGRERCPTLNCENLADARVPLANCDFSAPPHLRPT